MARELNGSPNGILNGIGNGVGSGTGNGVGNGVGTGEGARQAAEAKELAYELAMIQAVRVYCNRVSGQAVRRITLTLADQSRRSFTVPGESPLPRLALASESGDTLEVWPKRLGWDFRPGEAAWNGIAFRIAGKPAGVLRVLAAGNGGPVADSRIVREVWGDDVEPHSIQAAVSQLRMTLRKELRLDEDPVVRVDGGYRINIL